MQAKVAPDYPIAAGVPMLDFFKQGRMVGTLMVGLSLFCCMLMVYGLGTVFIALLGFNNPMPMPMPYLLIGAAGATTIGTQIARYVNTAQSYPQIIRTTDLCWAAIVDGRCAAIEGELPGVCDSRNGRSVGDGCFIACSSRRSSHAQPAVTAAA